MGHWGLLRVEVTSEVAVISGRRRQCPCLHASGKVRQPTDMWGGEIAALEKPVPVGKLSVLAV